MTKKQAIETMKSLARGGYYSIDEAVLFYGNNKGKKNT